MWVIFEGLDKAGKGTLEWGLLKATNFKHMVIDRGPAGYMTFDKIFGRSTKLGDNDFIHHARKIMKSNDFMVVYCKVNSNVAKERIKINGETCPYEYDKAQKIYDYHIRKYYKSDKVIEVDTTYLSVEQCVELIVNKIEEVKANDKG